MRKPSIPASIANARWIVALVVLVAVAVVVSGKNVSGNHESGNDGLPGHNTGMAASSSQPMTPDTRARLRADFAALPLAFETNQGQTDASVKYMARGQGYQLFLTADEAVLAVHSSVAANETSTGQSSAGQASAGQASTSETRAAMFSAAFTYLAATPTQQTSAAIRMQFVGGNPRARVDAGNPLPGTINYYIGDDPAKWQEGVKQYSAVIYRQVYPGVDVAYHGHQRQVEFDFIVAPGANPAPITASFEGASKITTDASGNLLLSSAAGNVLLHRPLAYQEKNGSREPVESCFVLEANTFNSKPRVRFELGNYDHNRTLVIDPSVSYATYLGGSMEDDGYAIAIDNTGAAYVTGQTASTDFPTVNPEQGSNAGGFDVFVTKFAPGGASLDYSTYVGGSGSDSGNAIAVNPSTGFAYVAGGTASSNFPTTGTAFQKTFGGGDTDAFVFELSSSGGTLIYSTYLGGSGDDYAYGIALDSNGNTYIVGLTGSSNFPIAPQPGALQSTLAGTSNGFVTELNPAGSSVVYSTFLGGGTGDFALAVALDSTGNAYVTGEAANSTFPVHNPFQKNCGSCTGGMTNAFVSVIQSGGTAFVYSTFLGGSSSDQGQAIAVDSSQDAYVTGVTLSTDFPTTKSAAQRAYGGNQDAFVTALNPSGSGLVYSTYLGGSANDAGGGIAVDGNKNVYVTGQTGSSNFPLANATQPSIGGGNDAFVTEINPTGSQFVFSTFLGGAQNEDSTASSGGNLSPAGIAVDSAGANIYVTGNTFSSNFPVVNAEQGTIGGGVTTTYADAFVAKYTQSSTSPPSFTVTNGTLSPSSGSPGVSASATITVASTGGFNSTVSMACSVSPAVTNGPTCSFSNPSVTPPSNGSPVTTMLNVATTAASAQLESPSLFRRGNDRQFGGVLYALLLPLGLALLGTGMGSAPSRRKKLLGWMMLGALLAAILVMLGCSSSSKGGGGDGGTPANTYTITVTGTSGSTVVTGAPPITLTVN